MPVRALRPCVKAGCAGYRDAKSQYCAQHAGESKRLAADYEERKAPMANLRATKRWRKYTRPFVLSRDPLCKGCGILPSTDCDHIERAEEIVRKHGEAEFYNPDRCQGLCHGCHSKKTAVEVGFAGAH